MVDRVVAAAAVLRSAVISISISTSTSTCLLLQPVNITKCCRSARSRVKKAATYETVQAPPATLFLQALHSQIPTDLRLTVFLPQNVQAYRACWLTSIFFTCFRSEAPYLFECVTR